MFSKKTLALLTLLAISGSTSASGHARRHEGHDELTTTSTEIVYVTITQTVPLSDGDDGYTVLVTPPVPTVTETTTTTEVEDTETPYPTETSTVVEIHVDYNGSSSTWVPSVGYTTLRTNETGYSTSGPSQPSPTDDEDEVGAAVAGVQVGMKSLLALAGMVGAGMFML